MTKLKIVVSALALAMASSVQAMSDEEYVAKVKQEFRLSAARGVAYGAATTQLLIEHGVVSVARSSGNAEFDAEAVRAAEAAIDETVTGRLTFPVSYSVSPEQFRETQHRLDQYRMR